MHFEPLGDQAVMAYAEDETAAGRFAAAVRQVQPIWVVDVVQAYTSVAVYYDLGAVEYSQAQQSLQALPLLPSNADQIRRHVIPCCYELGLDLDRICQQKGLARDALIRLHQEA